MLQRGQLVQGDRLGVVGVDVLQHIGQNTLPVPGFALVAQDAGKEQLDLILQNQGFRPVPLGLLMERGKQPAQTAVLVVELDGFGQLQLGQGDPQADDLPPPLGGGRLLVGPVGGVDHCVVEGNGHAVTLHLQVALSLHKVHQLNVGVAVPVEIPGGAGIVKALAEFQLRTAFSDAVVIIRQFIRHISTSVWLICSIFFPVRQEGDKKIVQYLGKSVSVKGDGDMV